MNTRSKGFFANCPSACSPLSSTSTPYTLIAFEKAFLGYVQKIYYRGVSRNRKGTVARPLAVVKYGWNACRITSAVFGVVRSFSVPSVYKIKKWLHTLIFSIRIGLSHTTFESGIR